MTKSRWQWFPIRKTNFVKSCVSHVELSQWSSRSPTSALAKSWTHSSRPSLSSIQKPWLISSLITCVVCETDEYNKCWSTACKPGNGCHSKSLSSGDLLPSLSLYHPCPHRQYMLFACLSTQTNQFLKYPYNWGYEYQAVTHSPHFHMWTITKFRKQHCQNKTYVTIQKFLRSASDFGKLSRVGNQWLLEKQT